MGGARLGADRGLVQAEVKVPGDLGRKGFAMRNFLSPADLGKATHPSASVSPSSERIHCLLDTEAVDPGCALSTHHQQPHHRPSEDQD